MLVDAHAHIDRYHDSLTEAIRQIEHHRILTIAVSMDIPSYLRSVQISSSCSYVIPIFGVHPWEAEKYAENPSQIDRYLKDTPIIGEAGLDFFWITDTSKQTSQRSIFEYQCEWARRLSKPMNLHTKGAEKEVIENLERFQINKSIIHWYSGPINLIEKYLSLGCYFTIGVEVLSSDEIGKIVKVIPPEHILLETDNPGGYEWLTKQEGIPELLLKILEKVALLKGLDNIEFKTQLDGNWKNFVEGITGISGKK